MACQKTNGVDATHNAIDEHSQPATITITPAENKAPEQITLTPFVTAEVPEYTTPSYEATQKFLEQLDKNRVLQDLRKLTGMEPICSEAGCYTIESRETGSEGLTWAKDYVYRELLKLGYAVEFRNWSRDGYSDQNLVARKMGERSPGEEIYFVAHMDGVEYSPAADDNASGVVAVLELARILSAQALDRTVVLFFSTGEEHGVLGTRSYLDKLSSEELAAIRYVVNVDMLSYDSDNDGVMQLWSGDHPPSLAFTQRLSEIISTYDLNLTPHIISGCT